MRLLRRQPDGTLSLTEDISNIPSYAILSHTWGGDEDEVTFADLTNGTGHDKTGYQKIRYCAQQAALDGLEHFWVDTCCIDKSNHVELSTAINSMFQWYKGATKCYVYLSDVDDERPNLRISRWFTRGWTLQELVAPSSVEFFSSKWQRLGDKKSLEAELRVITGISVEVLRGQPLSAVSAIERMSWLTKRDTKLPEDMAYCALGIFDVYMPFNYGERENAFRRLQEEIDKKWKIRTELPLQLKTHIIKAHLSNTEKSSCSSIMIPFSRDEDFVERGIIFDQIHQIYSHPSSWTALVGLGGVGKSQIAIEYAYRTRDRNPDTWVFWVHASNAARFEQSFRDIANYVGIAGSQDEDANIFQLVHDWLCNGLRKWFLILDNVDNASFLVDFHNTCYDGQANSAQDRTPRPLISYIPHYPNGSVLITSRSTNAARELVKATAIISVGPMEIEDAVALIQKKLREQNDDDFGELATSLDFMPLAIVQATSYISHRAPRSSVKQYLELFRSSDRKKESLLNQENGELRRDREANNSIINTWQISFDHIHQTRRSAADLLSLMSFCDRQGIPESLLRNVPTERERSDDESGIQDSDDSSTEDTESQHSGGEGFEYDIITLRDYSFIHLGGDEKSFTMHSLVQLATQKWLKEHGEQEQWRQQFLQNLNRVLPNGNYENWPICRLLVPHVKVAASQRIRKEFLRDRASILYKAAWYAWRIGNNIEAEQMSIQSMNERKNLWGDENEDTLDAIAMVGLALNSQGLWGRAEAVQVQVMGTRKTKLGADHPDTLTSMSNLASTYRNQGRWDEAEELQVHVMETRKTKLGADHPDTLTIMSNLAVTYSDQGRWNEAEELQVQEMETCKTKLGADHPYALSSMSNLALTYRNQGRWDEAEELQVQVMETSKTKLGADHPNTLTIMSNLAWTYHNQGRWDEAEELQVHVMETCKTKLGTDHPNTLTSMSNLASTYRNKSRWDEAEELQVHVMETYKTKLGAEHPDMLASMSNLALTYHNQGRWDEAEELQVHVMETSKTKLGADHPDTLTIMSNLAWTYRDQGRWDEAEELQVHVMETCKTKFGADHPNTLTIMSNLALMWKRLGRVKEAIKLMTETISRTEHIKGAQHPHTLTSNKTLAEWKLEEASTDSKLS